MQQYVYTERDGKRRKDTDRKIERQKTKIYMENVRLKEEDALDRTKWKNDIRYHCGDPRELGKSEEKKKKKEVK